MWFWRRGRQLCWRSVVAPEAPSLLVTSARATLLDALLDFFAAIFTEPRELPPPRNRDHSIVLLPGLQPVAIWTYRYPVTHKDELER